MPYDNNNIFAKILRGEIPCKKIFENAYALSFADIHPQAPTHMLVIPKGPYVDQADFAARASEAEIIGFTRAVGDVVRLSGLADGGYRLIANSGANGGQEVPHYHVHIMGGRSLGPMLSSRD